LLDDIDRASRTVWTPDLPPRAADEAIFFEV
jgi:hypothetical protein